MPYPYDKIPEPEYNRGGLFKHCSPSNSCAYVDINRGVYALSLYSSGFFEAASRIGDRLIQNKGMIDIEIYPLVYLYRHAIEVAVKYIHRVLEELLRTEERFKCTHKIMDNWKAMRGNLEIAIETDEFAPKPNLDKIQQIIEDLVANDPTALAFRYPEVKKRNELAADLKSIDVQYFCGCMEYVRAELRQIINWLGKCHPSPII